MKNISIKQIADCLLCACDDEIQVTGYQVDSRLVGAGALFFALRGAKSDGHDFLREVAAKGAVGAVVEMGYQGPGFGLVLLRVDDVVAALQRLAQCLIEVRRPLIIGITGSLGKTSTKEFVATLLGGKFKVGKTYLNYNTKLTVPITLLNREGDEDVMVVEMGMSEPGDIGKLVAIAPPDIAVLTYVARAHVAYFPRGVLDIAVGKAEIFSHLRTKTSIYFHGLGSYPEAMRAIRGEGISFSVESAEAGIYLDSEGVVRERGGGSFRFTPPFKEKHVLHNFLAAVSVARAVGLGWDEIAARVGLLTLPKMRFEKVERGGVLYINDAYNANPDSMKAALSSLPMPKEGGRKVAVLGMMVEMGPDSLSIHQEVGSFAAEHVDYLLSMGEGALPIYEAFSRVKGEAESFMQFAALVKRLQEIVRPGDVVLVKASRAVQMETVFKFLE